jgi:hypothetical protein
MDVGTATSSISETVQAVVLIGAAYLMLVVARKTFQWVRHALDDEEPFDRDRDGLEDFDYDTDDAEDAFIACDSCGYEAFGDDALAMDQRGYCTKCGE